MKIKDLYKKVNENASAGSTGAGAIASIPMPMGTVLSRTGGKPTKKKKKLPKKPSDTIFA